MESYHYTEVTQFQMQNPDDYYIYFECLFNFIYFFNQKYWSYKLFLRKKIREKNLIQQLYAYIYIYKCFLRISLGA